MRIVVSGGKTGTSRSGRANKLAGERKWLCSGIVGFIMIAFYIRKGDEGVIPGQGTRTILREGTNPSRPSKQPT